MGQVDEEMLIVRVETVEGEVGVLGVVSEVVEGSDYGCGVEMGEKCSKRSRGRGASVEGGVGGYSQESEKGAEYRNCNKGKRSSMEIGQ